MIRVSGHSPTADWDKVRRMLGGGFLLDMKQSMRLKNDGQDQLSYSSFLGWLVIQ